MLRLSRFAALAAFGLGVGSAVGCATPGFKFEYVQPPLVINPTGNLVQTTSGTVGLQPSATMVSPLAVPPTTVYSTIETAVPVRSAVQPRASDCTLEDACARIKALEASRPAPLIRTTPEPLPAPRAVVPPPPMKPSCD